MASTTLRREVSPASIASTCAWISFNGSTQSHRGGIHCTGRAVTGSATKAPESTAVSTQRPSPSADRHARYLKIIFGVQLLAGFVNVLLLAPVWMQIVHLLLANLVLLVLILFSADILSHPHPAAESRALAPQVGD